MGKRFLCLVFAAVLIFCPIFGIQASAAPVNVHHAALSRAKVIHRPNALVSAMFLVLAGVGVSMLFDKKN